MTAQTKITQILPAPAAPVYAYFRAEDGAVEWAPVLCLGLCADGVVVGLYTSTEDSSGTFERTDMAEDFLGFAGIGEASRFEEDDDDDDDDEDEDEDDLED